MDSGDNFFSASWGRGTPAGFPQRFASAPPPATPAGLRPRAPTTGTRHLPRKKQHKLACGQRANTQSAALAAQLHNRPAQSEHRRITPNFQQPFDQGKRQSSRFRFALMASPSTSRPPRCGQNARKRPASRFLDVGQGLGGSSAENSPTARKAPQTPNPLKSTQKNLGFEEPKGAASPQSKERPRPSAHNERAFTTVPKKYIFKKITNK